MFSHRERRGRHGGVSVTGGWSELAVVKPAGAPRDAGAWRNSGLKT